MNRLLCLLFFAPLAAFGPLSPPLQAGVPGIVPPALVPAAIAPAPSDTLYVSDGETTYLLFPEEVLLVDIGRPGDYAAKIEGSSVFLKARHRQAGPTNLLVRFGSGYYTARLLFSGLPPHSLYDLRTGAVAAGEKGEAVAETTQVGERLERMPRMPELQPARGYSRDGLSIRLVQLQNDEKALYLGLWLANSSSIDYRPDFVGFTYLEQSGRRFSRNNRYRREVRPLAEEAPALVPGRGEALFWYALPLFALSHGGRLEIVLREGEGARHLRLRVPARMINGAARLEEGHGE